MGKVLLFLIVALAPAFAVACGCTQQPGLDFSFRHIDNIFLVRVIQTTLISSPSSSFNQRSTFEVLETFKGTSRPYRYIWSEILMRDHETGGSYGSSGASPVMTGSLYLIIANPGERLVNTCGHTVRTFSSNIDELRSLAAKYDN